MKGEMEKPRKDIVKRYVNKNQSLYLLIDKIKLWPSRSGVLHGIKSVELHSNNMKITTHCGEEFSVWNSKNSRSARWLRNRWCTYPCKGCNIPEWKLSKYSSTVFSDSAWAGRK